MKKKIIIGIVIVLLAGGGFWFYKSKTGTSDAKAKNQLSDLNSYH